MSAEKSAPFKLPKKAVDRFRVEWWEIRGSYADVRVVPMAAVYHVNSKWRDVCPGYDRTGSDFVNHWQIFDDGDFKGRTGDGWAEAFNTFDWSHTFGSRESAIKEAVRRLRWRMDEWKKLQKHSEEAIAALEAELA